MAQPAAVLQRHPGHVEGVPTNVLLEGVSKTYRLGTVTVVALDHVDLEIDRGEFVVILGPSGSGKTTLLNIAGALDTPTEGHVFLAGQDTTRAKRRDLFRYRRLFVSFIFQTFNLFPSLTALENVQFAADVTARTGRPRPDPRGVLADVGLGDRMDHFPHELSGGEQQRVAIARALATENPILLADEPTGELDFKTGVQILALLQREAAEGKTVIVVTHNREISRVADRVIELSSGRIVGDGPPAGGKTTVDRLHW